MVIATLFTMAKTWKKPKCPLTDEWIKKMWYIYIYNRILLSYRKEWNNAICSNMDESRDYHTKWSKSDRERQILYDMAYIWNLKRWYRGFPGGAVVESLPANAGGTGSSPGLGRSHMPQSN